MSSRQGDMHSRMADGGCVKDHDMDKNLLNKDNDKEANRYTRSKVYNKDFINYDDDDSDDDDDDDDSDEDDESDVESIWSISSAGEAELEQQRIRYDVAFCLAIKRGMCSAPMSEEEGKENAAAGGRDEKPAGLPPKRPRLTNSGELEQNGSADPAELRTAAPLAENNATPIAMAFATCGSNGRPNGRLQPEEAETGDASAAAAAPSSGTATAAVREASPKAAGKASPVSEAVVAATSAPANSSTSCPQEAAPDTSAATTLQAAKRQRGKRRETVEKKAGQHIKTAPEDCSLSEGVSAAKAKDKEAKEKDEKAQKKDKEAAAKKKDKEAAAKEKDEEADDEQEEEEDEGEEDDEGEENEEENDSEEDEDEGDDFSADSENEWLPDAANAPAKERRRRAKFACGECPLVTHKKSRFAEHLRTHSGEKPFECPICHSKFRIRSQLMAHQQRHLKVKPFPCPEPGCDLRSATKQDLALHLRHHRNDRRYKCPVEGCPKAFVRKTDMVAHRNTHNGERPHKCDICGAAFAARSNLCAHMKVHLEPDKAKKFKCDYCPRLFYRPSDRNVHHNSHTGYKPFVCKVCGRAYSSRVHVRNHTQREHPEVVDGGGSAGSGEAPVRRKRGPKPGSRRRKQKKETEGEEEVEEQDEKVVAKESGSTSPGWDPREASAAPSEVAKARKRAPKSASRRVNGQGGPPKRPQSSQEASSSEVDSAPVEAAVAEGTGAAPVERKRRPKPGLDKVMSSVERVGAAAEGKRPPKPAALPTEVATTVPLAPAGRKRGRPPKSPQTLNGN